MNASTKLQFSIHRLRILRWCPNRAGATTPVLQTVAACRKPTVALWAMASLRHWTFISTLASSFVVVGAGRCRQVAASPAVENDSGLPPDGRYVVGGQQ